MKLIYSELALFSLREIVNYLKLRWTDKEIKTLRKDIEKFETNDIVIWELLK